MKRPLIDSPVCREPSDPTMAYPKIVEPRSGPAADENHDAGFTRYRVEPLYLILHNCTRKVPWWRRSLNLRCTLPNHHPDDDEKEIDQHIDLASPASYEFQTEHREIC